ncbi:MAG: hypothetical protein RMI85_02290 [Candidatus Korarchaeum sp.]|nr:hypothetical protein [Candidatus Korarchaeum sp.]
MRSGREPRGVESLYKVIEDLGLNEYAKISVLGSMIKVEVKYDPLEKERKNLNSYKVKLKSINPQNDSTSGQLIQQIEQLLRRVELARVERVLVAVPSPDGLKLLEDQLVSIQKDIVYRKVEMDELRKLVRLFLSYVREYLRGFQ